MTTVLVAHASKHGATAEIAAAVAQTLNDCGLRAACMNASEVESLEPYDAVVLGSAVYMKRWRREARRFLRHHAEALEVRPFWVFSSGPVGDPANDNPGWSEPHGTIATAERLGARDHPVFGGSIPPEAHGMAALDGAEHAAGVPRPPRLGRDPRVGGRHRRGAASTRRGMIRGVASVHLSRRSNWLRAAVLGADDGIVSTASLVLGVAASGASGVAIVTAGIAGMVAGALSMAAGEYVSVSSQRDAERADIRLEERELSDDPSGEMRELAGIYEQRGLPPALAGEVALTLSRRGALAAHVRDELGLDAGRRARPFQAAWTSALSFLAGAVLPLVAVAATPASVRVAVTVLVTLIALALLGDLGARLGGAPRRRATVRIVAWGAVAMGVTSGIGALVGTVA